MGKLGLHHDSDGHIFGELRLKTDRLDIKFRKTLTVAIDLNGIRQESGRSSQRAGAEPQQNREN